MLRSGSISLLVCVLIFLSCNKKKKDDPIIEPQPLPEVTITDERPACAKIPPGPEPTGWKDSLYDENTNVNAFLPNPLNGEEYLCVVNGDVTGYNKLLAINPATGNSRLIVSLGPYLPQISKSGWIVYSDVFNNIYKIKCNGDSLKQLTFDKSSHDPKWDYTGKNIYFFRATSAFLPARLLKTDASGNIIGEYAGELPYHVAYRNKDKVISLVTTGNFCTLVLKDMSKDTLDIRLLTAAMYSSNGRLTFEDLTIDREDKNLYWSNSKGIFRFDLAQQKTDTVFKNCENSIYSNFMVSFNTAEFTYTVKVIKPINKFYLLHEYKTMEYSLLTKASREIKLFPR